MLKKYQSPKFFTKLIDIDFISENSNKIMLLNTYKLIFILVFLFPIKGLGLLSGIPILKTSSLIYSLFILMIIFNIKILSRLNLIILLVLILFKLFFLVNPINLWTVCIDNSNTPLQDSFQYEYFENRCEKSFNFIGSEYTTKVEEIKYGVINYEYEWMGSNSSNFPLGFLNHSAYNFYDLRRDWLPFNMIIEKQLDQELRYIKINYLGYVKVKFDDNNVINLPSNYSEVQEATLKIPNSTNKVNIEFLFKNLGVAKDATHPSTVPNDFTENKKFAYFEIIELNNNLEKVIIEKFYLQSILLLVFLAFANFKIFFNIQKRNILIIFLILFACAIFSFFQNIYFLKYFGFIALVLIYFLKDSKQLDYLSIGLIYLVLNTFIIDLPWNQLDFNIKPSGSDILTYENQARLIFEGDGLRGGADVFWYSPGYRYLLYFVHIIFGDGWGVAWKIILAVTIFLIYKISKRYEILPILLVLFLVFDNVRNLYLFGVSETLSLLFILLSIVNKKNPIISSIFLAVATLIRPEIILFSILFLIINKSNLGLISFGVPMLFPLLHNIFYGGEFVIMSTAATYSRNITFDIQNNLPYLIFNPFSQKVIQILGMIPTVIAFSIIVIGLLKTFGSIYKNKGFTKSLNFIFWISLLAPYFIYDPVLFYPRHVLISLVIFSINFDEIFFKNDHKNVGKDR